MSEHALTEKSAKIKAGVEGGFTPAYFGTVMSFIRAEQRHAGDFFFPWQGSGGPARRHNPHYVTDTPGAGKIKGG